MRYVAAGADELAPHSEVRSSASEVKRGLVRRNNTSLPGEASSRRVAQPPAGGWFPVKTMTSQASPEVSGLKNQLETCAELEPLTSGLT